MTQRARTHATQTATTTAATPISLVPPPSNDVGTAESAWTRHLAPARLLDASAVLRSPRVDLVVAASNLAATHATVFAHRAEITAAGMHADWDALARDADLSAALTYAPVLDAPEPASALRAEIDAFTPDAQLLAADARTLVLHRALPAAEVDAVLVSRTSIIEVTRATLQLAAMYRVHHATVSPRTTIPAARLDEIARAASDLLPKLGQSSARDEASARRVAARRDLRDRVWTLAVRHHEALCRLGGALWGRAVVDHLPALHRTARRRAAKPAAPTPEPTK